MISLLLHEHKPISYEFIGIEREIDFPGGGASILGLDFGITLLTELDG